MKKILLGLFLVFSLVLAPSMSSAQVNPNPNLPWGPACTMLTLNMKIGASDPLFLGNVTRLQNFLVFNNYLVVPAGVPLGFFGVLTQNAVIKFQTQFGLVPDGVVGPLTRQKIADVTCAVPNPAVPNPVVPNNPNPVNPNTTTVAPVNPLNPFNPINPNLNPINPTTTTVAPVPPAPVPPAPAPCGPNVQFSTATGLPCPQNVVIQITNDEVLPSFVVIPVGSTITWHNTSKRDLKIKSVFGTAFTSPVIPFLVGTWTSPAFTMVETIKYQTEDVSGLVPAWAPFSAGFQVQ
ncbi:MAG: peptidoglycan-binding protein [bacterium]|nr:peptidoglycan-binding protein [bacterium]